VKTWCIPPKADADFVWHMEDVLQTYQLAYDPLFPVVCMDEASKQLIAETRDPVAEECGRVKRVDHEYERKGVCNLFMFFEPLRGWRKVWVTDQRRKVEWAWCVKMLLEDIYPKAKKVILVCDNLNTHTIGAFYEAFDPATAWSLISRLEFRHTPKHGSWLNISENELSAMTRQCVQGRRFATIDELRAETAAWHRHTNERQRGVDWQFRIDDARGKLKSLYPKIKG